MRQIRWTAEASDQLEATVKRIQQDNPGAARNVAQAVIDGIEQLATFPGVWPARRVERNPRTRHLDLVRCVPFHRRNCRNPAHLARCARLALKKIGDVFTKVKFRDINSPFPAAP